MIDSALYHNGEPPFAAEIPGVMRNRLLMLSIFAVAMAYLEAAVVVYLRAIYYPGGFSFPLVLMPKPMVAIEVGRELSTLVMLWAVAMISGHDRWERFLHFSMAFGVWDIFYYVWLWVQIRWPSSLVEWDVLFLIPIPWLGPVLAPVVISLSLVAGSLLLLGLKKRGIALAFPWTSWTLAILAGLILLGTFLYDWRAVLDGRMPRPYPWVVFALGQALGVGVLLVSLKRLARAGA